MPRRLIVRNASFAMLQVVVSGAVLLILYRYLLDALGAAQLGIWSLVLATTSVSRIAELGLSGSGLKFVAQYLARDEAAQASAVVQTATISIAAFIGLLVLAAYSSIGWILGYVIPPSELELAISLLPYALASFWLSSVAGVAGAGLEGCQRFDLRAYVQMGTHGLYLVSALWLIPSHGLYGVAYAQVFQAALLLLASWLLLRNTLSGLSLIPCRWSRSVFRELLGYGLQFLVISVAQLLYDPVTKTLIAKFGGLELTGYYEMASRLILQLRALLVNANRVLIPVFANLLETAPEDISKLYRENYRLLFYFSVPIYGGILALLPVISEMWIGHYERYFVLFAVWLIFGWALNTLSGPAYFAYLGVGRLRWNTVGHVLIGVLNGALGFALGFVGGGVGVVIGWVVSLVVGSGLIVYAYHREQGIPLWTLLPRESRLLVFAAGGGALASWAVYKGFYVTDFAAGPWIGAILVYVLAVVYPFWSHPLRGKVIQVGRGRRANPAIHP